MPFPADQELLASRRARSDCWERRRWRNLGPEEALSDGVISSLPRRKRFAGRKGDVEVSGAAGTHPEGEETVHEHREREGVPRTV